MPFEPTTITLRTPLQHGDKEITKLTFNREAKVKDFKGVSLTDLSFEDTMTVAGRMLALPPSVLMEMSMPDYFQVSSVVMSFFDDSQETGQTSLPS